jgi:hypothetical protein
MHSCGMPALGSCGCRAVNVLGDRHDGAIQTTAAAHGLVVLMQAS